MRAVRSKSVLAIAALVATSWLAVPAAASATDAAAPAAAAPAKPGALQTVSCPVTQFCVATGVDNPTEPYVQPAAFIEMRRDGRWTRVDLGTFPSRDYGASAVSCSSAAFCAVVMTPRRDGLLLYSLIWNGTTWRAQPAASPGGRYLAWTGVSCVWATSCVGVGSVITAGREVPFTQRWNGSTWTLLTVPPYPGTRTRDVELMAVSCASDRVCEAVGYRTIGAGSKSAGIVVRLDASGWSWLPGVETPAAQDLFLYAVSCASTTTCAAVGTRDDTEFLLTVEDGVGSRRDVPGAGSILQPDISCPTGGTKCVVVARSFDPADGTFSLRAQLVSGDVVRDISPPDPAPSSLFVEVSCVTVTACVAVGFIDTSKPGIFSAKTLVETWNGSRWTRELL